MSFCKGYTQGGSNADVVIADAFIKNLTDGVDWAAAYEAVVSDAEVEPESWGVEGRGNLDSYHRLGFIPWNDVDRNGSGPASRTVSRQVEYAYDDFCIAQMARGLGHEADARKYHGRGGPTGASCGTPSSATCSATAWATWSAATSRASCSRGCSTAPSATRTRGCAARSTRSTAATTTPSTTRTRAARGCTPSSCPRTWAGSWR